MAAGTTKGPSENDIYESGRGITVRLPSNT